MSVRIYDAEFAPNAPHSHQHLAKFWWTDGINRGIWTRNEAYDYVDTHRNTVYVAEGGKSVWVYAHYNASTGTKWIQTAADGALPDNLITLAMRHR